MTSTTDTSTTDTTSTTAQRDIVELVPGLPLPDIERELATASRSTDVGHRTVAFYLDEIQQRQLFNITAHASAVDYAVKRMKMKRRQARDLYEVGRVLHDLPVIDAAFLAGNLNWTTVRELSKVATAATEADWLDHTKDMTTRQLEHAVKSAERGRAPRDDGIELAKVTFKVQGKLRLLPYEKWELAKQKISAERDEPVTDARFMEIAAELVLSTRDDGSVPGREPVDDSLYRLVIQQGATSGQPQLLTEDGPLPIDRATAETIACVRPPGDRRRRQDRPADPRLAAAKRIRARDGFKCRCCDGRRQLMVHHIFEQSRGGEHASENLVLLCMPCHARVHSNLLVIEGTPATGLRFLDRTGRSTNAPAATAPDVLRMQIQAPATIAVTDGARAPLPLTFATLPSSMDAADWRRHAHLFSWNDRRGTLELRDGLPVEVPDAAASSQESVSLNTLVGQERVIQNLTVAIKAAQLRQSVLPHVLLSGGHGLGKTTIARAVATEMNAPLRSVSSPLLKEPSGIVQVLTSLRDKECFIDEVQSLPRAVAETLYEALQDGKLSLHVSAGTRSKMVEVRLCAFTLIGATTDEGALPAPLRSRFPVRELLESYDTEQLRQLLCKAATAQGIAIEMAAAELLATVSDGTPREALSQLVRARDQAQVSGTAIDLATVERTLAQQGIDRDGLRPPDRKALARLARGGAVSLKSLADSAGLAERTFAEVYEPGLIRRGLIAITPHGRIALHPRR